MSIDSFSFDFQRGITKEDLELRLKGRIPPAEGKSIILRRTDGYRITIDKQGNNYPLYTSNYEHLKGNNPNQNSRDSDIFVKLHSLLCNNLGDQTVTIKVEEAS